MKSFLIILILLLGIDSTSSAFSGNGIPFYIEAADTIPKKVATEKESIPRSDIDYDDESPSPGIDIRTTAWNTYEKGANSTMAVLLTDVNCAWLSLAHGLKTIGIPFIITTDYKEALKHKVVMVYPMLSRNKVSLNHIYEIRDYVRNGGTLIGIHVMLEQMSYVFGFELSEDADNVNTIEFNKTKFKFETFADEKERILIVRNSKSDSKTIGTVCYKGFNNKPIAQFNDGTAAIIENKYGKGIAYSIGVDLGGFLSRGYSGRQTDIARSYANRFEPHLDVLLRLIREFYREAGGVTLGTVPDGKHLAVVITHDIDFTPSVRNSFGYAKYEYEAGIRGTYFMQTKYVKDWSDSAFFTRENIEILRKIKDMNMEMASHSVSHSKSYINFQMGDGKENTKNYHPFVNDFLHTVGGTILGELRVSKFLMDSSLKVNIVSFRPGHLSYPIGLPQAMVATGFKYSSSMTANDALTHYPFQLNENRQDFTEVPAFEFPVTVEDEEGILGDRLQDALKLANQVANYDGLMLVLIHPNILGHKLEFEKGFVKELKLKGKSWFGSVSDFGDWWSARNQVRVAVEGNLIKLDTPHPIKGLTLLLPNGKMMVIPEIKNHLEITF